MTRPKPRYNETTTPAEWRKFWKLSREGEDGNNLAAQRLINIGENPDYNWELVSDDMQQFWSRTDVFLLIEQELQKLADENAPSMTFLQVSMLAGARNARKRP